MTRQCYFKLASTPSRKNQDAPRDSRKEYPQVRLLVCLLVLRMRRVVELTAGTWCPVKPWHTPLPSLEQYRALGTGPRTIPFSGCIRLFLIL